MDIFIVVLKTTITFNTQTQIMQLDEERCAFTFQSDQNKLSLTDGGSILEFRLVTQEVETFQL